MHNHSPNDEQFTRYLRVLNVAANQPDYDTLDNLARAHLRRVPFENISKLLRRVEAKPVGLPSLQEFLNGIEQQSFGGTCYTNNYFLNLLLAHMGYQVKLCGAAMDNPDVHVVNIVTLDNREHIVDVGYAAPFDRPLPRDLVHDYEIKLGHDQFVVRPQDTDGFTRVDQFQEGKQVHGYVANPAPRKIAHFDTVIADSFTDDALFMRTVRLSRFAENYSLSLRNLSIRISSGHSFEQHCLANEAELIATIEKEFGISAETTARAIAGIDLSADVQT